MARTALTNAVSAPGTNSTVGVDFAFQAGDAANNFTVSHSGYIMVLANNTSADTAYDVTIQSVADDMGRVGNIVYEVGFGEFSVFGPFRLPGWGQADGALYVDVEHNDVDIAIINI